MAVISQRLAEFTARLSLEQMPAAVRLRAKHLLLDALGCAFAARREEFATRIAASVARLATTPGPSSTHAVASRMPGSGWTA